MAESLDEENRKSQRPYSIRTRIKTCLPVAGFITGSGGQRPYSIRTRIKTLNMDQYGSTYKKVRDHIPLEQGLRLALPCL